VVGTWSARGRQNVWFSVWFAAGGSAERTVRTVVLLTRFRTGGVCLGVILMSAVMVCGTASAQAQTAEPEPYVVYRVQTKDPVVFITIDDGVYRSEAAMAEIRDLNWPVVHFLPPGMLRNDPSWFERFGEPVEFGNHSETHMRLKGRGFDIQKREICQGATKVKSFVSGPITWLRPPYGVYDKTTVNAAKSCKMRHIVLWNVEVVEGRIHTWGGEVKRGDIILLHHRKELAGDLRALERKLRQLRLRPAVLSAYLDT
jgi:peptidoglycan/xylan/chitin deacetylase (PgdA/CDA1 family)